MSVGVFIYCFSWSAFLIPNDIANGGVTGACAIIQIASGGRIPVSVSYMIINGILLAIAFAILGRGFGFKTVFCIALSTVLFAVFPKFEIVQALPGRPLYISEKVLIPIIGGALEALGIQLVFQQGGSTGGTDIVALIINRFWPVSPGKVFMYMDVFIIATILFIPGKGLQDMVYGYIAMITFSLMLDFLLLGRKSTVQVLVFSSRYDAIADYIIKVMDRGVTALNAVGWYTRKDRKVLLIIIRRTQLSELTRAVKEIDREAFVCVSPASSVFGEGFEEIKTGISRKKSKTIEQ